VTDSFTCSLCEASGSARRRHPHREPKRCGNVEDGFTCECADTSGCPHRVHCDASPCTCDRQDGLWGPAGGGGRW
jgi:hypothetical protein